MKVFVFESEVPLAAHTHEVSCSLPGSMSIVIDRGNEIFSSKEFIDSSLKVYVMRESFEWGRRDRWAVRNQDKFDLFVTTQKSVISKLQKPCLYVPFATSWVEPLAPGQLNTKDFAVSYMPGAKIMREFEGHAVRHALYRTLKSGIADDKATPRIDLYSPEVWVDKKEDIFDDYQFSVVIENVVSDGWFTEKIVDSFLRKTVPIYRGDPNIGNIFDKSGILSFVSIEDFFSQLLSINQDTYASLSAAVENNYKTALSLIGCPIALPEGKTMNSFNARAIAAAFSHFES